MRIYRVILSLLLLSIFISAVACNQPKKESLQELKNPSWSYNATIYELNMRQFTPEGSFNAAREELPRLKELGVDVLWLMPIQPIGELNRKGSMGSYYAIKDYLGVNSEYGTKEELEQFIASAHDLGFKVILDWVANHTAPDAVWIENDGWHKRDQRGELAVQYDWYDITELDYNNSDMQRAMIDAMKYWVEEMKFDGFRCDMAMLVPTPFWERAVDELREIKPDLFMLAEAQEVDLMSSAFNAYYGWSLHHIMNGVAQGKNSVVDIWDDIREREAKFDKSAMAMIFTSNHDENSHAGTVFERMGDGAIPFAAFSYLVPSIPLIYTGQELGNTKSLEFFEKDTIQSSNPQFLTQFYKELNSLRKENQALYSGEMGGEIVEIKNDMPQQVFSMSRSSESGNRVVAVMNLSSQDVEVTLGEGGYSGEYTLFPTEEKVELHEGEKFELSAWEYMIFVKN